MYYPWVTAAGADGSMRSVPPVGAVAGVWARVDSDRGVHKAPANEGLKAFSLEREPTDDEQALLNDVGVDCLRVVTGASGKMATRSIQTSNARTLSKDGDWLYIPVRHLANYLTESIRRGMAIYVFEPNNDGWEGDIRRSVSQFLTEQWEKGAPLGKTADEAFDVVCDETNNPPQDLDTGIRNIEISVTIVRTAEFITFNVQQIVAESKS
ncbi:phage tail sheath family protein [Streptomyces sp. cg2]|uniref:phage tail sheath family protein n=1 Tax=Streptomyces sp. cg2 TaxID=3238799 RepID=UPI0034E23D6B